MVAGGSPNHGPMEPLARGGTAALCLAVTFGVHALIFRKFEAARFPSPTAAGIPLIFLLPVRVCAVRLRVLSGVDGRQAVSRPLSH